MPKEVSSPGVEKTAPHVPDVVTATVRIAATGGRGKEENDQENEKENVSHWVCGVSGELAMA